MGQAQYRTRLEGAVDGGPAERLVRFPARKAPATSKRTVAILAGVDIFSSFASYRSLFRSHVSKPRLDTLSLDVQ
jgi:hypothetical protein